MEKFTSVAFPALPGLIVKETDSPRLATTRSSTSTSRSVSRVLRRPAWSSAEATRAASGGDCDGGFLLLLFVCLFSMLKIVHFSVSSYLLHPSIVNIS